MPVICTKDQDKLYDTITTRLYSKNNKEDISNLQTFKTFSITNSDTSRNTKILSGTAIQNSTLKAGLSNTRETITHEELHEEPHLSNAPLPFKEAPTENNEQKMITEEPYDKNSIISGSQKLQDLKNLHKQLRKSSIEPETPLFEPRRPTMEAIRDAIERAKKLEINRNKNVGTDDDESALFLSSDASTSTDSVKMKKKVKKKKPKAKTQDTESGVSPRPCSRKPKKSKRVSRPK